MKRSRKKLLIVSLSVVFGLVVVLPLVAAAVIKWAILPPEKLTPIVLKYTRPLVNGNINCERVELTFINTFPKVGLKLDQGEIISYNCKDSTALAEGRAELSDTLLKFSRAMVTVDIMDYLRRNRVTVERLFIEDPFLYGLIAEDGTANWDVLRETAQGEKSDTTASQIPIIDLKKVRIKNGHFIYEDRTEDIYVETAGFGLAMTNQLRKGNLRSDIKTGFRSLVLDTPQYLLENDLTMRFESKVDLRRGRIGFSGAKLAVNEIPFSTDGEVGFEDGNLLVDVEFATDVADISKLLDFIPEEYLQNKKKITTRGSLHLAGSIRGAVGDTVTPEIKLHCVLDKAALMDKATRRGIERLDTDLELMLSGLDPGSSYIAFDKLDMVGTNTSFSAKGRITRLLSDPYIVAALSGRVDLEAISQDILNPDSITVKGIVEADIEADFRLEELMNGDFARLNAAGRLTLDRMLIADRAQGMSLYMRGVRFSADTTRRESRYLTEDDLISATLQVDTMSIRYGWDINTRLGGLDLQAKTSRSFDTTKVVPVSTNIRVATMRARLPDSVWVAGNAIHIAGGIKASASDPKKGMFAGIVKVDTVKYFDPPARTRLVMDNSTFTLEMMPMRDAMRRRAQAATGARTVRDSTARPRPQPGSLRSREAGSGPQSRQRNTAARTDSGADSSRSGILRNWEIRGSVKFDAMRAFTSMFPLPVRMDNTTLRFDTDKVNMTDARLKLGKSDFIVGGEISGMRRAMMRGGVLKAALSIESGYIDCNQLMRAIARSTLYNPEEVTVGDEDIDNWDVEPDHDQEPEPDEGIFVVPKNIDMVLKANARRVDYGDLNLENIDGEIVVRNQSVNLRKLHLESNVGQGDLTMVYTARDKRRASAGLELDLQGVIVEDFIGLFPGIDELLPMLRSFEGVLDCQITATCDLDSTMNVVFPSLHSACYLSGENMVLMDGQTFAEISKKLMFKNKERNLIEYISVDLLIKDNKVEIYPFLVEMDRYKLAVGGVHNLDMTFDYHVSVLKSPVPFKLGLDIKGDLDDFKFRIVKCRYKELFKVAREEELQQTRYNLRSGIRETIQARLMQNAPELGRNYTHEQIGSRRPQEAVTDMDEDIDEESYVEIELEEYQGQTTDGPESFPGPDGVTDGERQEPQPDDSSGPEGPDQP
ncbi:MAG: AsmA-like C-terminal region-containing protein [Alistipes sp.]|nr:AsmA-like C-terminal region-containing protein [Alistipes sp.]